MWILTYEVNDYNQYGEYFQHAWFGAKPDVTYLASYLKYAGICTYEESWFIREQAQKLHDGEIITSGIKQYRLWEQERLGAIPMY